MIHNLIIAGSDGIVLFEKGFCGELKDGRILGQLLTAIIESCKERIGLPVCYIEFDTLSISIVSDLKTRIICSLIYDRCDGDLFGRLIATELLVSFIHFYSGAHHNNISNKSPLSYSSTPASSDGITYANKENGKHRLNNKKSNTLTSLPHSVGAVSLNTSQAGLLAKNIESFDRHIFETIRTQCIDSILQNLKDQRGILLALLVCGDKMHPSSLSIDKLGIFANLDVLVQDSFDIMNSVNDIALQTTIENHESKILIRKIYRHNFKFADNSNLNVMKKQQQEIMNSNKVNEIYETNENVTINLSQQENNSNEQGQNLNLPQNKKGLNIDTRNENVAHTFNKTNSSRTNHGPFNTLIVQFESSVDFRNSQRHIDSTCELLERVLLLVSALTDSWK